MSLDEIPSRELVKELGRRGYDFRRGLCPYCKKEMTTGEDGKKKCTCRFGPNIEEYHNEYSIKPLQWGGTD